MGLPTEGSVTSIVFNPADYCIVFVSDYHSGIYVSTNAGDTWQVMNNGLRTRTVNVLSVSTKGQFLYAATEGEGVLRWNDAGSPIQIKGKMRLLPSDVVDDIIGMSNSKFEEKMETTMPK